MFFPDKKLKYSKKERSCASHSKQETCGVKPSRPQDKSVMDFYAPAIFNAGGAYSITLVCTSHTYKNGLRAISFEYIGVLDSYFIYVYNHTIQVKFDNL